MEIKYELKKIDNPLLLKQIKKHVEIFRMLGFTTFEQGKKYEIGFLSKYGQLKTNFQKNNKKIIFKIDNDFQKITMVSNLETIEKNTEFTIIRKNEKIVINHFLNYSNNHGISITKETENSKSEVKVLPNSLYIFNKENELEKSLYYTDLSQIGVYEYTPYLIANYFEESYSENKAYKKEIQICRYHDRKGFYLETKHNNNGLPNFKDKSIFLNNKKDAATYALELLESKETKKLVCDTFFDLKQTLMGFDYYIKKYSITKDLFKDEIDSELYRIYCGVQKRLHEMTNPIRIEQLFEEMNFEKSKTKTLKSKA